MHPVKKRYSLYTLLFLMTVTVSVALKYPPGNILSWDVFGYYLYLPSAFIYEDPLLEDASYVDDIFKKYNNSSTFYQVVPADDKGMVIKYSSGMSLLYSPFFFAGHLWAGSPEHPEDGFSKPYQRAVLYGSLLVSLIGLYFLRKVSLRFLSDKVTAILLLLLFFGTNYSYNLVFKGAAPHNYLFTLYTLLLWVTIKYHEKFRIKYAILIGLLLGMITLIRPTDIVALLIPVFWNVRGLNDLRAKAVCFFKTEWRHLVAISIMVVIVWTPQFIYWKVLTGNILFYSYDNPGEGFEFLDPYIFQVLFSFRKGWLIYTPMMIFSIAGIYFVYRLKREIFLPVLLFFLVNLYLVSSWSCWWYGGSFGQRALVQSYAVMALPLGFAIKRVLQSRSWVKILLFAFAIFFMVLNLFQIWQIRRGIIHEDRMTREYYFAIFGKTSVNPEDRDLLLVERSATSEEKFTDEEDYLPPHELYYNDFEGDKGNNDTISRSGSGSFEMNSKVRFSPGLSVSFHDLTDSDHAWIRAGVYIMNPEGVDPDNVILVCTFDHNGYYKYRAKHLSEYPEIIKGEWNYMELDYMTPEVRSTRDKLTVYVWFRGEGTIYVDDLKVVTFVPR